ncbi:GNAT family N-acetyltransferase [Paraferrimonas sp. SM1919]|uniref:GNAT family N-acetyltransferase n=1 Tax=Paraferrimonas sp. SM1919 TaxID=2662263 RepID=UPI0013D61003|nr:GNAT family N-acetyltransferase [Paraferrimonas sp. SM1919]
MDYFVSEEKALLDIEMVHDYLANESYWARGIPKEVVLTSIENSMCFGVYSANKQQLGFARLITDKATFGYLADVFILKAHRGLGLSKLIMNFIDQHPQLQGLRRMMLATHDAHSLYQQYGFVAADEPDKLMQKKLLNPYNQD